MVIRYVTCSFQLMDHYGTVNVVTHDEFNNGIVKDHERRLCELDGSRQNHDESIKGITETVKQNTEWIHGHTDWIRVIETKVNNMPQMVKDSMMEVLSGMFAEKMKWLEHELNRLRDERKQMEKELSEVRNRLDGNLGMK